MRLADIDTGYDLVIVGGGVTGAAVFSRATALGFRALLVEAKDFAWGTSSRSSKMVHGGLRYLKQGKFMLTRSAVKERERLLRAYPGLVTPLKFLMPIYRDRGPSKTTMAAGLSIYSLMAGRRQHRIYGREEALERVPELAAPSLASAVGFKDSQVDDARLVLRLIFDTIDSGGHALNYTRALSLGRNSRGAICSLTLEAADTGRTREIRTPVVINATGAFAEALHPSPVKGFHIRPLRGSHMIFPGRLMALDRVVSFTHPRDSRPVYIFPWQGALVLGTTDVDHGRQMELDREPGISESEINYLMEGLRTVFPGLALSADDALSATAGIRAVLSRGKKTASRESREHVVWKERGLVTVTGGKLTTFALLAADALKAAAPWLKNPTGPVPPSCTIPGTGEPGPETLYPDLSHERALVLKGRYGRRSLEPFLGERGGQTIGDTHSLWAELAHGAANEQVRHLDDLLLRRIRIGLLLPRGGMDIMDEIQKVSAPYLNWDSARWEKEIRAYEHLWEEACSPGLKQNG